MLANRNLVLNKAVNASVGISLFVMLVTTVGVNMHPSAQHGNVLSQHVPDSLSKIISTSNVTLIIQGVSENKYMASTDLKLVSVSVVIQNLSTQTLQVAPGLQMFLRTNAGKQYDMTASYLDAGTNLGGPLSPKAATSLRIDFEIPAEASPVEFIYQADASSKPEIIRI